MQSQGATRTFSTGRRPGQGADAFGLASATIVHPSSAVATQPWLDPDEPPAAEQRFPPDWDEQRVRRVIEHYLGQFPEAQVAEDEAAARATAPGARRGL